MPIQKFHDEEDGGKPDMNRRLAPPSSDMNVTPLIDVLLVLLIIFMSTLPLTQRGEDINLPLQTNQVAKPQDKTQIVAEYGADHQLTLNKQVLGLPELQTRLRGIFETRTDKTIFIIGDGSVRYGEMIDIIDVATGLGLHVAIVTPGMKAEAMGR